MLDINKLDRAFNPQSIAVIGDKDHLPWLRAQKTFQGRLYSVQISPQSIKAIEALGIKNYTSLLDIPDEIDLAIVAVPRAIASRILEDCIQKGVAAAHFFTAGFSETDTEEGKSFECQIIERAKRANFYVIGPNCMGVYNPKLGVRQNREQYAGFEGTVGFISQSGTHATDFALVSHTEGVYINKCISFGNGVVLDVADYLEYFGQDNKIKAIGIYLEGVKQNKRFFSVLREVSPLKPVVIWKGGRTEEGARATASHTGSLAMPQAIWEAAVKQCGAISVRNMEELNDTLKALLYLPPVYGNRVAVTGISGGQCVAVSDAFAEGGLALPRLTQESYDELVSFFSLIGAGYQNPIDTGAPNLKEKKRIMQILDRDKNIDNLVALMVARPGFDWDTQEKLDDEIRLITDFRRETQKPLLVILPFYTPETMAQAVRIRQKLQDGGVPAFPTFERAARAIKNALDYYKIN